MSDDEAAEGYRVAIQPEAESEIQEAYQWYESKAEGLGAEFIRAVDACLATIERNPTAYTVLHQQIRRALLRRFPYGIFYLVEGKTIAVPLASSLPSKLPAAGDAGRRAAPFHERPQGKRGGSTQA